MSSSCRHVCCALAVALPVLLLMLTREVEPTPLFGLLDDFGSTNATSLLAALALAHIDHTIDKLTALATLAETAANLTSAFG